MCQLFRCSALSTIWPSSLFRLSLGHDLKNGSVECHTEGHDLNTGLARFFFSLFWSHCVVVVSTSTCLLKFQSQVDKVWENKKRKVEKTALLENFFSSFLVVNELNIHTLLCVKSLVQNKWVRQTFFFYPRSSIFTMTRTLMKMRGTEKEKIKYEWLSY